jgi:beta-RFAP synthase
MTVVVTTGARLHFGLLCGAPDSGWHYGGVGMMVDQPAWRIKVSRGPLTGEDVIHADDTTTHRVKSVLSRFRQVVTDLSSIECSVHGAAPFHSGLGAGTQFTLALGTALLLLSGKPRPDDISDFASALDRSRRSAVGTYGFDHGGFVIDHGIPEGATACRAFDRVRFPDAWRMVMLSPQTAAGLSGETEETFFGRQDYLADDTVSRIGQLIETDIAAALRDEEFHRFRDALESYGHLAGEYYSAAQGGVFSNRQMEQLVHELKSKQITGAVQSSWGPTVCIPADSEQVAEEIQEAAQSSACGATVTTRIVRGLNSGATITTTAPAPRHRSFG